MTQQKAEDFFSGEAIRLKGVVQGVGMRPTVWRLARSCGVVGNVCNDNCGVQINIWGSRASLERFKHVLKQNLPPLCKIESFICSPLDLDEIPPSDFTISESDQGAGNASVTPDAATCPACLKEVLDLNNRRYRYPFSNCTHCGPRFSIVRKIPFDRENTAMAEFPMCTCCKEEYLNPLDRRFHAQANACPECGPTLSLENAQGSVIHAQPHKDLIQITASLIRQGEIVAIKGLGGIHLACDASNHFTVANLRRRKNRYKKAFALMGRNIKMISTYASVSKMEAERLCDAAAPIVVLRKIHSNGLDSVLSDDISPGQNTLGFMLPYTPLHHLLMQDLDFPIVLTSGNVSDESQCIDNAEAKEKLSDIADYFLLHDREIENRQDDSVLRIQNNRRFFIRRGKGYAPQKILVEDLNSKNVNVLAMGAELKNTFCLLNRNEAIVSQHIGDLENVLSLKDYRHNLGLYERLFRFNPDVIAVDKHPEYLSTKAGKELATQRNIKLIEVQHHHAHIAACMAEHGLKNADGKVLGIALDGLGYGDDNSLWGSEFLVADYCGIQRVMHFQAMAMPGGTMAIQQPWRNTFAYLHNLGWQTIEKDFPSLELIRFLRTKPVTNLNVMLDKNINSPLASSAGRLFDAVAAAIGVCREVANYEGQAAIELEALAEPFFKREESNAYHYSVKAGCISWQPMWYEILHDLARSVPPPVIASRFHHALINAVTEVALILCRRVSLDTVVLSGGVFQNQLLLKNCFAKLKAHYLNVLIPEQLPANDGGISLGQALVAAHSL